MSTRGPRDLRRTYINGKFHEDLVFDGFRVFQKHYDDEKAIIKISVGSPRRDPRLLIRWTRLALSAPGVDLHPRGKYSVD